MNLNPYEAPRTPGSTTAIRRRLDRGVLAVASVMLVGCLVSVAAFVSDPLRDFLMPRFGWIGLLASINSLMFIGFWILNPTRRGLIAASLITCSIGVINGVVLMQTGTVAVVENAFTDRLHSAWIWSVVSYLCIAGYLAFAAIQSPGIGSNGDTQSLNR